LSKASKFKIPATLIALLIVFTVSVALRLYIVAVIKQNSDWTPFTLESALLFHYAENFAMNQQLEPVDYSVQYPEGVQVYKKFSLGKGIIAAWLWRMWPAEMSFADFVRIFDAVIFSTGAIALFWLILELTRFPLAAFLAALLYAVALPAVQRSTGLEFSRENFALPFLFFHICLYSRAVNRDSITTALIAALPLALAAPTWDMSRLYLVLLIVYVAIRTLVSPQQLKLIGYLIPSIAAAAVVGVVVPYLMEHHFLTSYCMVAGYGLVVFYLVSLCKALRTNALRRLVLCAVVIAAIVVVPWISGYSETYTHFRELLAAKIRFFNVKPEDPAALSFVQRMMWTPALHSATSRYPGGTYPIKAFVPFLALGVLPFIQWLTNNMRLENTKVSEGAHLLFFMTGLFLVLYLLFVRMQVFLIFFLCAVIGLASMYMRIFRWKRWLRVAWAILLVVVISGQALGYADKSRIMRTMTTGEDYSELKTVVQWIKSNTEPDAVVLSDFGLSPVIYHYTGRKIVLHPKFESRDMREKYREYIQALFHGSEKVFYDFCLKYDVDYFIFHNGTFAGRAVPGWIYTPRYISGRKGPIEGTEIFRLSKNRGELKYFFWFEDFTGGIQYSIFRVATPENIETARQHLRLGEEHLTRYFTTGDKQDLASAEKALVAATHYYPGLKEAYIKLTTVFTMQGDGTGARFAGDRAKKLMGEENR